MSGITPTPAEAKSGATLNPTAKEVAVQLSAVALQVRLTRTKGLSSVPSPSEAKHEVSTARWVLGGRRCASDGVALSRSRTREGAIGVAKPAGAKPPKPPLDPWGKQTDRVAMPLPSFVASTGKGECQGRWQGVISVGCDVPAAEPAKLAAHQQRHAQAGQHQGQVAHLRRQFDAHPQAQGQAQGYVDPHGFPQALGPPAAQAQDGDPQGSPRGRAQVVHHDHQNAGGVAVETL